VFALLALDANRVVSLDRIIDEVWRGEPPAAATLVLQSHVSRLRRLLATPPSADEGAPQILTQPPGWVLRLRPDDVDATRFAATMVAARKRLSSTESLHVAEGVRLLEDCLSLWQGDALSDLDAWPFARDQAARLEDLRLTAKELLFEGMLALGNDASVAQQARQFVVTSHSGSGHGVP